VVIFYIYFNNILFHLRLLSGVFDFVTLQCHCIVDYLITVLQHGLKCFEVFTMQREVL